MGAPDFTRPTSRLTLAVFSVAAGLSAACNDAPIPFFPLPDATGDASDAGSDTSTDATVDATLDADLDGEPFDVLPDPMDVAEPGDVPSDVSLPDAEPPRDVASDLDAPDGADADAEPDAEPDPEPDLEPDVVGSPCDAECPLGEACDTTFEECRPLAWSHTLHLSDNDDTALGVAVDGDDSIYVTGCRDDEDPAAPNVWLTKFNRFGDLLWTHETDINPEVRECGLSVELDHDGNVVLLSSEFSASDNLVWVRRLAPDGTVLSTWSAAAPRRSGETYSDLAIADDGGYLIGGSVYNGREERDAWLGRFDSDGVFLWDGTLTGEGGGSDTGQGVAFDADGRAYVAGWQTSTLSIFGSFVQARSDTGDELWWLRGTGRSGARRVGFDVCYDPLTSRSHTPTIGHRPSGLWRTSSARTRPASGL